MYVFDSMGDIALDSTFLNAGPEAVHVPQVLRFMQEDRLQMVTSIVDISARIPGSKDIDMHNFHFKLHISLKGFFEEYQHTVGTHHIGMMRGGITEKLVWLAEIIGTYIIVLK